MSASIAATNAFTVQGRADVRKNRRCGLSVRAQRLAASDFMGNKDGLELRARSGSHATHSSFVIEAAITKAQKAERIANIKDGLEGSMLVAAFNYQGMTVKELIKFRRSLPEGSKLVVAKNTLMLQSTQGTKFETIAPACTGMNAYLFCGEDVSPTIKALKKEMGALKKDEGKEIEWVGGCLDGQFLGPKDIDPLENLPTKQELYAKIAFCVKQVPTKLARGIKAVPTGVAYGVKAIADGESKVITE